MILVDNSPSAMILPTSILDIIEEANDYYFPTLTGMYLKISRALITFLTIFLTPVFLLFMQNLSWLPKIFAFVAVKDTVNIPLIFQLLMLEVAIDGLRLAALNTPSMLSTPLSVIAGLVMGEFSVKSGWFNAEVMLYMAFVAVANYTQPNFELGYALKFMRLMLLVLTELFALPGLLWEYWRYAFLSHPIRQYPEKCYLYPLFPFSGRQLKRRVLKEQTREKDAETDRRKV